MLERCRFVDRYWTPLRDLYSAFCTWNTYRDCEESTFVALLHEAGISTEEQRGVLWCYGLVPANLLLPELAERLKPRDLDEQGWLVLDIAEEDDMQTQQYAEGVQKLIVEIQRRVQAGEPCLLKGDGEAWLQSRGYSRQEARAIVNDAGIGKREAGGRGHSLELFVCPTNGERTGVQPARTGITAEIPPTHTTMPAPTRPPQESRLIRGREERQGHFFTIEATLTIDSRGF